MNLFLIEMYIKKIKKEDIYNYALSQNINLTENELNILHTYLKTKYKPFLTNPCIRPKLLAEVKSQVNYKTANKLDEIYNLYKDKI